MRRRVDLRWRIRPEEIDAFAQNAVEPVARRGGAVKPGGMLVYSTCSLEPEENGEVIQKFLIEHPDFKLEGERQLLPFLPAWTELMWRDWTRAASHHFR